MSVLQVEEVGDNVSYKIEFQIVLFIGVEYKLIGNFLVSVEGVDEVISADSVTLGIIVIPASTRDFVSDFLGHGSIDDHEAVL